MPTQPSAEQAFGHYTLLTELGRGGQGTVWLAEDHNLKRKVALKVLSAAPGTLSPDRLQRFHREAEAVARLDDPHICALLDAGDVDGVPFLAFRYLEGETLAERIARAYEHKGDDRTPTGDQATTDPSSREGLQWLVRTFEKLARALHKAHESGLIHRDVKPGNIMILPDGEPVLLDFGLARDELAQELSLTHSGDLLGTPAYMSPEQLVAQRIPLDRRTDVYSLGATLYEALTLQKPFVATTRAELYQKILSSDPSSAVTHNRQIPRDLQIVLETAMEKDRNRRYQTAQGLAEDLRRVLAFEPVHAKPIGRMLRLKRWAQRHPASAVGIGALALGFLTVLGFLRQQRIELQIREALMASVDALDARPTEALRKALEAVELDERTESLSQLQNALAMQFRSAEVQTHAMRIESIAWSERHQLLLTTGGDGARLSMPDGKPAKRHHLVDEPVFAGSFSPDEDRILTVGDDGVRIWTWHGDPIQGPLAGTESETTFAVWLDRTRIVTGHGDGSVSLWSADSGTPLQHLPKHHDGPARGAACTGDGKVVTHGDDGIIRIWDSGTGEVASMSLGEAVTVVALDLKGERLVAGGKFGMLALWTLAGEAVAQWHGHRDKVHAAAFATNGRIVTSSQDSTARLWSNVGESLGIVARHSGSILGAAFVADESRIVTWSGDGSLALWSEGGERLLRLGSNSALACAVMCGTSRLASGEWNGQLVLWELDGREQTFLCRHDDRIWDVEFDGSGRLATPSWDGSVGLWTAERRWITRFDTGDGVGAACFLPGGRLLVGTLSGELQLWDVDARAKVTSLELCNARIRMTILSPDESRVLVSTGDRNAFLVDCSLSLMREIAVDASAGGVKGVWLRNGSRIALIHGPGALQIRTADGDFLKNLPVKGVNLSPQCSDPQADGVLTISNAGSAYLWDLEGNCRATFPGDVMLLSAAFSPDGESVVTARKDGTAQVWRRAGGNDSLVFTLREPAGQVTYARFTPDGKWIVTASSEGTVRFWPTSAVDVKEAAHRQLTLMGEGRR